jgi:small subunit ribosomal protein S4
MIIGPRYKIARRLGAHIFDKTQSPKFALSEARHEKNKKRGSRRGNPTNFARQLLEKQKIRFGYGVGEKQMRRYVQEASTRIGGKEPALRFLELLEMRLDNAVYRAGFAASRRQARQLVTHGHFTVNGKRLNVPSYQVAIGDVIAVREGSKKSAFFEIGKERLTLAKEPNWMVVDESALSLTIMGTPDTENTEAMADLNAVMEFSSR